MIGTIVLGIGLAIIIVGPHAKRISALKNRKRRLR